MYDKCQGYNRVSHLTSTPIYMPKQYQPLEQQIKYNSSTPSMTSTPTTPSITQQTTIPDSTLQTLYSSYIQSLSPTQSTTTTASTYTDSDTLKFHKFYQLIPFKCPFCFAFKEQAGEFVEHLTAKHYLDIKLGYEKLNSLTNGKILNGGTSAFRLNNSNKKKDDSDLNDLKSNSCKSDYEPLAKKFMYSIKNNDNNDISFNHLQKSQENNKNEIDMDDEDEEEDDDLANNVHCTSSCCNTNNNTNGDEQQNGLDYTNRLIINSKIYNHKTKCLSDIDNRFSNNNSHHNLVTHKFSRNELAKSLPSTSSSMTIKQQQQPQMLNLNYLMSSVSSMHCAICNRGFEYYSNLRRHIKTKHKIFGKEVKEYVIRHNNPNSTNSSNNSLVNQFQRSQSQQISSNQINSINNISNNRSNTSSPIANLNSKKENSIKQSPKAEIDEHSENNNKAKNISEDDESVKINSNNETDSNNNNNNNEVARSPLDQAAENEQQLKNSNDNQNENENENTASSTTAPIKVTNQQSCTSPLSPVSSHSSIYSSVSPNSVSPSRSYSPPTTGQNIFSNMSSCMSTKFKTSLLETLLTRKTPQNKPVQNNVDNSSSVNTSTTATTTTTAISNPVSNTTPITTTIPPTTPKMKIESNNNNFISTPNNETNTLDSITSTQHLSLYQLAQQQQQQNLQQFFLQNNLSNYSNDLNSMNNFKKLLRNFAKSNNFPAYSQFEDYSNQNLTGLPNGFPHFGFKNSFNMDTEKQQYLQQHKLDHSQDSNDNRSRFHLNQASPDDPCDDDYQSNHEDYDDIENSNCSSFNNNNNNNNENMNNKKIITNSQLPLLNNNNNGIQDSPINMNIKTGKFDNNNNNQVRYSTEIWRCPYCCYETTSASRYNSHLVCHGWKPYLCPHCGSRSNRLPDMRTHISTFHPEHNVNTFVMLNEEEAKATLKDYMKNRALINRKLKEMRPQPKFKCKLCPYASLYQFNLTKHVKSVHLTEVYNETRNDMVS